MTDRPIPEETWRDIVRHAPIVSVDLIVRHDGSVVLGKRTNVPVWGEWFVAGGRVHKDERLDDAVARVARAELGVDVAIEERLGSDDIETKHYLANGVVVTARAGALDPDDQRGELRVSLPPFPDLHPYVEAYLCDAGFHD